MLLRKKILSILFLLIFAVPVGCTIAYWTAVKINAYQMEESLEQSLLETVLIDSNELVWVTMGKEAFIKGKFFDVKSSAIINGKIILTGLFDTTEDAIAKKITSLQNNKSDSSSPVFSMLAKLLCPAILQQYGSTSILTILFKKDKFPALLYVKYCNPLAGVTTPPPNA
jgi:hypothetical protein